MRQDILRQRLMNNALHLWRQFVRRSDQSVVRINHVFYSLCSAKLMKGSGIHSPLILGVPEAFKQTLKPSLSIAVPVCILTSALVREKQPKSAISHRRYCIPCSAFSAAQYCTTQSSLISIVMLLRFSRTSLFQVWDHSLSNHRCFDLFLLCLFLWSIQMKMASQAMLEKLYIIQSNKRLLMTVTCRRIEWNNWEVSLFFLA